MSLRKAHSAGHPQSKPARGMSTMKNIAWSEVQISSLLVRLQARAKREAAARRANPCVEV
jgi:hypothetical protein